MVGEQGRRPRRSPTHYRERFTLRLILMKKVLVNYADRGFQRSQKLNSKSGLAVGCFDEIWSFGPHDIDHDFQHRNQHILSHKRGAGYWLWKPYFVNHALQRLQPGDFMFYCDSGSLFIDSVDKLIAVSKQSRQDLLCFDTEFYEKKFTKRDAFVLLDCDEARFTETKHRLASFSLWKKSEQTTALAAEWLAAAQDERLLTDLPNQLGLPNFDGFSEHRHDQSIFSLLTKRYGLRAFRDPSQWGNAYFDHYPESAYPQVIVHTRSKNLYKSEKFVREIVRLARQFKRSLSPKP